MATRTATETEYVELYELTRNAPNTDTGDYGSSGPRRSSRPHGEEATANEQPLGSGSAPEAYYPTGTKFWLLMLNLAAIIALTAIDMNIVATAVPTITDHFHTVADIGWYPAAFRLCQCAFQFAFGKAYKLFRIKRVFMLANVFSVLGWLLCGAATSSTMLVIGRAIAGLGSAGIGAGSIIVLVQSTPLHKRPLFLGLWGAVEGLSSLAGPLLGGVITQSIGWRWCFYMTVPPGVVTLLLTLCFFSEPPKPSDIARMTFNQKISQLDVVSNVLLVPALTALFLAFEWAGTRYAWNSGVIIGLLVTFCVLLGAFLYNQSRRGDAAALPPRIVKNRSVLASVFFMLCLNSAGSVLEYYLPIYYQVVRGFTPAQSSYLMLPILIAGTLGAVLAGIGASLCGYYTPFMLFASVGLAVAAGLITVFKIHTSLAQLIVFTGLSGFAYGAGFAGPSTAIQTVLPAEDVPLGLSVILFAQSFGPAVMIASAQVLFTNQLSTNLHSLGLSATSLGSNGLKELVTKVPVSKAIDVLTKIDESIVQTWYLVVGLACATIIGSACTEWRSVKSERATR